MSSKLNGDPMARVAFEKWRISHPGGSIHDFFHRDRNKSPSPTRMMRMLDRAVKRSNDPSVPPLARKFAREDAERLTAALKARGME